MKRRQILAAMAAAGSPLFGNGSAQADEALLGELIVARLRDAMLGLGPVTDAGSSGPLEKDFIRAVADFDACRYAGLAVRLPRLIRVGHSLTPDGSRRDGYVLLAMGYLLATRMLVKVDEQQLGWMAAGRARQFAEAGGEALTVAESARQLPVHSRCALILLHILKSLPDLPLRDIERLA